MGTSVITAKLEGAYLPLAVDLCVARPTITSLSERGAFVAALCREIVLWVRD